MTEVRGRLPCIREVAEAGREHATLAFAEAPRERIAERRWTRAGRGEVELAVAHPQQHLRVGAQVAELVHLVVPRPLGAEMRARGVRWVEHVGGERLCPGVAVEASPDERAVGVPRVARVGCGVNRQHRQATVAQPLEDHGLLFGAPWRLADREERECASFTHAQTSSIERTSVDAFGREAVHLGDLRDADCSLIEYAVHTRGAVAIRRDLRDEQQPAQTRQHGSLRFADDRQAGDRVRVARPETGSRSRRAARARRGLRHARCGAGRRGRRARRRGHPVVALQLSVPQRREEVRPTDRRCSMRRRAKRPRSSRAVRSSRRIGSCSVVARWAVATARSSWAPRKTPSPRSDCSCSAIRCTPPASPTSNAAEHFPRLRVPVLFASGTRDSLAGKADLTKAARRIKGKVTFHWIETADHGYRPLKSSGRTAADVLAEVAAVATDWVRVLGH